MPREHQLSGPGMDIVYEFMAPWATGRYVGETMRGFWRRIAEHMNAARRYYKSKRMKLYKDLRRLGTTRAIWYPIACWRERQTKYTRTFVETEHIEEKQPRWKDVGKQARMITYRKNGELFVAGMKKKYRPLIKERAKTRGGETEHGDLAEDEANEKTMKENERKRRRRMLRTATRLARRPPTLLKTLPELGAARQARGLRNKDIVTLARVIEAALPGSGRSIAKANFKPILKDRRDIIFAGAEVKSALNNSKGVRPVLHAAVGQWVKALESQGGSGVPHAVGTTCGRKGRNADLGQLAGDVRKAPGRNGVTLRTGRERDAEGTRPRFSAHDGVLAGPEPGCRRALDGEVSLWTCSGQGARADPRGLEEDFGNVQREARRC